MSLKKGLAVFLLLSAAGAGALLWFSVDRESLSLLAHADPAMIALAAALVCVMWCVDALKLVSLTRAAGESISFGFAIQLTWINYFGAALTPMQSGGGPFQMYMMYRRGIGVGKTFAITLVRTFVSILILAVIVPMNLILGGSVEGASGKTHAIVAAAVLFIVVTVLCLALSLFRPSWIKRVITGLISGVARLGLIRQARRQAAIARVCREIDTYSEIIWAFLTTGRRHFAMGFLLAVLQMLIYLSVMPCLVAAIGEPARYVDCVMLEAVFVFLLYFMPTPGGSGAAEGGAAFVLSHFVPDNMYGVLALLWRFLTEHTGLILGTIVAMRGIGWTLANKLMAEKGRGGEGPG